ncbi:NADH-quinone oxidoreductase subunit L [Colwellia hornerae]|uniref:NADH-quinone oxidoreductase subunit L n=1 Tax=Colwellia hornerae TaxID=89402 RepID=A0A5C6QPF5_9GAMM|nr:NADH-quinone oxidoreductase subunit L [Colwellia hornerae]TWX56275.1 NADH-quinone oxidoreductase subunit L [Colwellia hornerae]TWX62126.1 NADH-quinone oxidoreductase subunit L [Colwellia hornerae]TWX70528.1 NADH-quinone oxidoreductase subunit L [Colwellia hornerae]
MSLLASLPLYPLISFLVLITFGKRLNWAIASWLSVGSMAAAALCSLFLANQLSLHESSVITAHLWQWFSIGSAEVNISFYLDALSAVMILVVTGVGFLIHLFAAIYMKDDENFSRFMAYMNLFIVAMLVLVLADNLVLLYLGWEGVGLCSFLLIGFWYQERNNVLAARKAFIVTRIGDTAMAVGLFLLFKSLASLNIAEINQLAQTTASFTASSINAKNSEAYWAALLLLGGAVGKSAQLPLQTWLPDAMAGPTPVSALIHAATMVTAGVYLIARMNGVFLMTPEVMNYVAWLGGITLLTAGLAALAQNDIKRVLAYSTMSQIGYMMLALGAGAWSAGVFHLMTHAFFKALLFLTAGTVILALHHQQDLYKMGGLLKKLPVEATLFLIGLACLIALPGTSGFFSKEAIIASLWSSPTAGPSLWWCAILGALLTSIYSCRLFFLAFLGKQRFPKTRVISEHLETSKLLRGALFVLALLSIFGGLVTIDLSSLFLTYQPGIINRSNNPSWLHLVAIVTPFAGILFSWFYYKRYRILGYKPLRASQNPWVVFCRHGLGFDTLYATFLIKPYCFIAKLNRKDLFDQTLMLLAWYIGIWRDILSASQNGHLRWFAAAFGLSMVGLIFMVIL